MDVYVLYDELGSSDLLYHQHLNPGSIPASYLAIHTPRLVQNLGLRFIDQLKSDLPEIEAEWKEEQQKLTSDVEK